MREWLDEHAPWALDAYWRLTGECWAQGCPAPGRRILFHSRAELDRCLNTPLAIVLTDPGVAPAESESAPVVPVVTVSHASA
jgi:hypothetical protein